MVPLRFHVHRLVRSIVEYGCIGLALAILIPAIATGAPPWSGYLQHEVDRIASQSKKDLESVTKENWDTLKNQWRRELQEMLGLSPWPEKTDLAVTIEGTIEREGVHIENLHFQPRPGLYVAANLYMPTGDRPKDGWPVVLYVCGHAVMPDQGRLLGNKTGYQHHGLWFARHGVACLVIDTIQLGELHGEHHGTYKMGRWDWISRGYTPAGVEAWTSMRAIDYLQSRPGIDGTKIGITGRSGGGAYSWFTAALDERIDVAVPVAGITDLENHVVDGCVEGHCDCMYFVNYYRWDYPKLAALIAPRPLLLTNTDSDSIFPLDGVMRTHQQLASLYKRLGKSNDYGVLIGPGPHKDIQELQVGAFRWLLRTLTGQEIVVDEAATKELSPKELATFQKETPAQERVTSVGNWFVENPATVSDPSLAHQAWLKSWRKELKSKGLLGVEEKLPRSEVQMEGTTLGRKWRVRELKIHQEWNPRWLEIDPSESADLGDIVVHLGNGKAQSIESKEAIASQVSEGWLRDAIQGSPSKRHVVLYPRGWDSATWSDDTKKLTQIHRRFYLIGESVEGLQLQDCQRILKSIANENRKDLKIELNAYDRLSPLGLFLGMESQSEDASLPKLAVVRVRDYPTDPRLAPCLPGVLRAMNYSSLLVAAKAMVPIEESKSSMQKSVQLLVDSSRQPQQCTGIRIVEVGPDRATVWGRATRWPLPNLGDLSEVRFQSDEKKGKQNSGAILPEDGIDGLKYGAPGVDAELRVRHRSANQGTWSATDWVRVDGSTDFSRLFKLEGLAPNSSYELRVEARGIGAQDPSSTVVGQFKTLPAVTSKASFKLAVGTCQEFEDRDGPFGFDLYRTMLERKTDAFFLAGDVVYYDKLARSVPLAHYHWQRTYALPTLVHFHRQVPVYFLKDDHDTYVNDSWPNQRHPWTDSFTFADGQRIFKEQTGLPNTAYRTFMIGKDLQIWLLEGRDYRDPNTKEDSPEKSLLGSDQKAWLRKTLQESNAKFRIILSPTPIVGPDREKKRDNLSNENFSFEGKEIRRLLASYSNTFVVCGDRHWQYHSVDPESKLHEFSVGPVSNRHAGGWNPNDLREGIHQYLRVAGGYLEIVLDASEQGSRLTAIHLDPYGVEHHRHEWR